MLQSVEDFPMYYGSDWETKKKKIYSIFFCGSTSYNFLLSNKLDVTSKDWKGKTSKERKMKEKEKQKLKENVFNHIIVVRSFLLLLLLF